jgi:biopolymer transport protein ExbD
MPEKVEKNSPQSPIPQERVMTIVLGEKDKIYWYQGITDPKVEVTNYSSTGIRKILLKKNAEIPKMYVFIKPSEKSRYKNVVDILDEIYITKMERFALVKITPEDSKLIAASGL